MWLRRQPRWVHPWLVKIREIRVSIVFIKSNRLIAQALRAIPDRPWSGATNGDKPITEAGLARRLVACVVFPRRMLIGGHRAKGYELGDFTKAFSRLPNGDIST